MTNSAFKAVNKIVFFFVSCLYIAAVSASAVDTRNAAFDNEGYKSIIVHDDQSTHLYLALENLALTLDRRFSTVSQIASSVANDTHIHSWVNNGMPTDGESSLLEKLDFLRSEFALTSASFADKQSNRYYNHEGFLAVLTPEMAPWYFAYIESGEQNLVSVYHDKNKNRVDIYVNYQQIDGNGLSGIASAYDDYADMLIRSTLSAEGSLYIVDKTGKVQVRGEKGLFVDENIFERYLGGSETSLAKQLVNEQSTNWIELPSIKRYDEKSEKDAFTKLGISYIESVGWYVVALQ